MSGNWLDYERFAVWGLGTSGKAAANLLARRNKQVVASDTRSKKALRAVGEHLDERVQWVGGGNVIGDAEVVVTSPGLRPGLQVFDEARTRGIPVISEVELAFDASRSQWVGITGTDGKTTTTSLVGAMLTAAGREHVVAGNIGTALCDVVDDLDDEAVVVAELSANQLWSCHHLQVQTAAITNIAEDHLDYFDDFAEYPAAKLRLVRLQSQDATTVLPAGDASLRAELGEECPERVTYFGIGAVELRDGDAAVFFDARGVGRWRSDEGQGVWFDDFSETSLIGPHNQLNAACAAAVAHSIGVGWEAIGSGLLQFSPLPHRMQPVSIVDGVRYIDDSKATNAHASQAGLRGIDGALVVIAGGRDKGLALEAWADEVARRADAVIVLGEIKERMVALLTGRAGTVMTADSLEGAVRMAHKQARPGSTVVLSPACSSYDMFASYKERGRRFQQAVSTLVTRSS